MPPSEQPSSVAATSKPKRRRWLWRIALGLAILVALAIIAIQIALWTSLPRNLAIDLLQKQLGLRVTAKSLSTGWWGNTDLTDVSLSLPLADRAFVTAPALHVEHSSLPWLLLTGSLSVHAVNVDQPTLCVTQDQQGRWNLQEVLELLTRGRGGEDAADRQAQASSASSPEPLELPDLRISQARIIVVNNRGRTLEIDGLSALAQAQGPLLWEFDISVPGRISMQGRVAPGGTWNHQFDLTLKNVDPWIKTLLPGWHEAVDVSMRWEGGLQDGGLSGLLAINDPSTIGPVSLRGLMDVSQANGLVLSPRGLRCQTAASMPIVDLIGGAMAIDPTSIQLRRLALTLAGGQMQLDGKYLTADQTASLHAQWQNVAFPLGTTQDGSLTAHYATPFPGTHKLHVDLATNGSISAGAWKAIVALEADGQGAAGRLRLGASTARFTPVNQQPIDLSGLSADLSSDGNLVLLRNLDLGGAAAPLAINAGCDLPHKLAWLSADARAWVPPKNWALPSNKLSLDFDIDAWADPRNVQVKQFYVRDKDVYLDLTGAMERDRQNIRHVDAQISLNQDQPPSGQFDPNSPVQGWLRSQLIVHGTCDDIPRLTVEGRAYAKDLAFWRHGRAQRLGDVAIDITGTIGNVFNLQEQNTVQIGSRQFSLLGGNWTVHGHYPIRDSLLRLDVSVKDLPLQTALDRPDLAGTMAGKWLVDVKNLSRDGIHVHGDAAIDNAAWGKRLAADRIDLPDIRLGDGTLAIDPMVITGRDPISKRTGKIIAAVHLGMDHPSPLEFHLQADQWPYRVNDKTLVIASIDPCKFDLDPSSVSANGSLNLKANVRYQDQSLGDLIVKATAAHRVITADSLTINALGGKIDGSARCDLDDLFKTRLDLGITAIQPAQLAEIAPVCRRFPGTFDGAIAIGAATTPRPLEPMALNIDLRPRQAAPGNAALGEVVLNAFFNRNRIVLATDPQLASHIDIFGGRVAFWSRLSKHADDSYRLLASIDLQNLDLNQMVHAGSPQSPITPGRVSGNFTFDGSPSQLDQLQGSGHVLVKDSDLAQIEPLATLYNLLHVLHDPARHTGHGRADLLLQGRRLDVTRLQYFDQGVQVRLAAQAGDVFKIGDSPISGLALGSLRPLLNLDFLGLNDIDSALSALQQSSAAVRITGTLAQPRTQPVMFGSVLRELGGLFGASSGNEGVSQE